MDSGTQNQGPKLKHRQNIEFLNIWCGVRRRIYVTSKIILHGKNIMKNVENIDFGNFSMNQNVIYKATTYLVTYVKLGFSQGVCK